MLVSTFCAFVFYSTAHDAMVADKQLQGLSPEGRKNLRILQDSSSPDQVKSAVAYFKGRPNERALDALAAVGARDESDFVFVRSDAMEAIAQIGSKAAAETLIKGASAERSPGVIAEYLNALYPLVDKYPEIVSGPLVGIIETAGGDVVGYPATRIARKLGDPRYAAPLLSLCRQSMDYTYPEYSVYCRDTIRELDIKSLHQERGISVNLPQSLDLIMTSLTVQSINEETRPLRLIADLWYLKERHPFSENQINGIAIRFLTHPDPMVRWSAIELTDIMSPDHYSGPIRNAFRAETISFLEGLIIQRMERGWEAGDCELVGTKLRRFLVGGSISHESQLRASDLIGVSVRQNCRNTTPILENISKTLEATTLNEDEKKTIDNAIQVLESQ